MSQMIWVKIHPQATPDMLGLIPDFLNPDDNRPARDQFDERYCGGWNAFEGFTMRPDGNMQYPGDPVTQLLYQTTLHQETIRVYEGAWVAIVQADGTFQVARLD